MPVQPRALALLAFLAVAPLSAQMRLGVVGGAVSSNLTFSGDDTPDNSSLMGFAAGLRMSRAGAGALSFSPEAMYITKGTTLKESGVEADIKLAYVEVPLLFQYNMGSGSSMTPFIVAGPSVAFKASCKIAGRAEGVSLSQECDDFLGTDGNETFKSMDYSGIVGVGVASNRLSVSARYNMGLTNINKLPGDDTKVKNKSLMLLVGFGF